MLVCLQDRIEQLAKLRTQQWAQEREHLLKEVQQERELASAGGTLRERQQSLVAGEAALKDLEARLKYNQVVLVANALPTCLLALTVVACSHCRTR